MPHTRTVKQLRSFKAQETAHGGNGGAVRNPLGASSRNTTSCNGACGAWFGWQKHQVYHQVATFQNISAHIDAYSAFLFTKKKRPQVFENSRPKFAQPPGIEPGTCGLEIRCLPYPKSLKSSKVNLVATAGGHFENRIHGFHLFHLKTPAYPFLRAFSFEPKAAAGNGGDDYSLFHGSYSHACPAAAHSFTWSKS